MLLFVFLLCATDKCTSTSFGDCVFQSAFGFEKIPLLRNTQRQRVIILPENGQTRGFVDCFNLQILLSVKFQPEDRRRRRLAGQVRGESSELQKRKFRSSEVVKDTSVERPAPTSFQSSPAVTVFGGSHRVRDHIVEQRRFAVRWWQLSCLFTSASFSRRGLQSSVAGVLLAHIGFWFRFRGEVFTVRWQASCLLTSVSGIVFEAQFGGGCPTCSHRFRFRGEVFTIRWQASCLLTSVSGIVFETQFGGGCLTLSHRFRFRGGVTVAGGRRLTCTLQYRSTTQRVSAKQPNFSSSGNVENCVHELELN